MAQQTLDPTGNESMGRTIEKISEMMDDLYVGAGSAPSDGFAALVGALQTRDASHCLALLGDSTGNSKDEHFYQLLVLLMKQFPSVRVMYQLWDDTTKDYGSWSVEQEQSGGEQGIRFVGVNDRIIPSAEIVVPGDYDITIKLAMTDWTPATAQTLVAHYGGSTATQAFRLYVNTDGKLHFAWKPDAATSPSDIASTAALGFIDGTAHYVRATLVLSTGVCTLYKSDDGIAWTQIGTGTGATAMNAVTYNWAVGARSGTTDPLIGTVYEVLIRDGVLGPVLNPQPVTCWRNRIDTDGNSRVGSPTLYVVNGSKPGAGIIGSISSPNTYLSDNMTRMVRPFVSQVLHMSTNHNESMTTGKPWFDAYTAWVAAVRARLPQAWLVGITENPEIGTPTIEAVAQRRVELMTFWRRAGLDSVIDTYGAFFSPGGALDGRQIVSDGIHPASFSRIWPTAEFRRYARWIS